MIRNLCAHIVCGALLTATSIYAQTPKPSADSPTVKTPAAHRHGSGLEIRVPAEWTAQDTPQGIALLPQAASVNSELYVAQMVEGYDPAQEQAAIAELSAAFVMTGAPMLRAGERQPLQLQQRNGSLYTWEFTDPESGKDVAVRFYLVPEGKQAFVLMAAGESQRVYQNDAALRQAAASMRLASAIAPSVGAPNNANVSKTNPPTPSRAGGPLADNTPLAQQWLQKLRGRVIRQFIGGGGVTGERSSYLAPDGTYSMRGSAALAVDVGGYGEAPDASASSVSRSSSTGRWYIRDQNGVLALQITLANGEMLMLPITWDNRNWYLDGVKSFAVDP